MISNETQLKLENQSRTAEGDLMVSALPSAAVAPLTSQPPRSQSIHVNDPQRPSRQPDHVSVKKPAQRLSSNDYARLLRDIRAVVKAVVPRGAIVAIISKGDSELVALKDRTGWHFPQAPDGGYSGYHPSDSAAAIAELEKLRARGADYLLIPSTAFWWLEHYKEFGRHLETSYQTAWSNHHCQVYRISNRPHSAATYKQAKLRARLAPAPARTAAAVADELQVAIDSRIPGSFVVAEGNAFYIAGWCYHPSAKLTGLQIIANGRSHRLKAWGMPRPDVKAAHYPHLDCAGRSYYSGFWGFVPFDKVQQRVESELVLRATLSDGRSCERVVGRLNLEPNLASRAPVFQTDIRTPLVAICMATHNPPLDLFQRQIDSIRKQSLSNWVCVISDDGSRPDIFEKVHRIIGQDRRFRIHRTQTACGFYSNFERCLALAPMEADFVALSDHDDYWHPDKLENLLKGFEPETSLVYSDMRIVQENGREISPTYWTTRPNNFSRFGSLLMANTITGGASMFRRSLLSLVLPFPERIGEAYHDHWIGAVALAAGNIKYINRPLYDYVQHSANVIGHYAPARPMQLLPAGTSLRRPQELLRESLKFWERVYSSDLIRIQLMTEILQLRCRNLMSAEKALDLRRIHGLGESWRNLLWLAGRAIAGRGKISETVGAERPLLGAALWRHSARWRMLRKIGRTVSHAPPVTGAAQVAAVHSNPNVETVREKIEPLLLAIAARAPRRLNLLIPTIDLKYFFGGYITKFNLARRLAEEGSRVRLVVVDYCDWQPSQWREQLKQFKGLEQFFERVEVAYAYDRSAALEVSPEDVFLATTWWTAHIAHRAARTMGRSHFVYLIQEYETFTFPMGSFAALANQSYEFPHYAVFSTEMLRTFFRENRLGVFAQDIPDGEAKSIAFQNAITNVGEITRDELANRLKKRLLYYARPEPHAARNMFELGIIALSQAVEEGYFDENWEFYGIGSVGSAQTLSLARGRYMRILPRETQQAYRDILRAHDLGLSLMYTPHPSLVPIEMASAGMVVVTTSYANKTQAVLEEVSSNLIAAHPSIERIKQGLKEASERVYDYERRVLGSHVKWPTSWESCFNPQVLAKLGEFVETCRSSTIEVGRPQTGK